MAYKITWEEKGTIFEFSCKTGIQEIHSANEKLHGDARIDYHNYSIWNMLDTDLSSVTKEEVIEPAATDFGSTFSVPKMKIAFVARETHAVELFHCYFNACIKLNSPWKFAIFNQMDDAVKWAKS